MTLSLTAAAGASQQDLHRARQRERLVHDELPRVRAAATAWRNGLGVLLAGLIGFGLLKGRNDVSALKQPYAVTVGAFLLTALVLGAWGALQLMRAAHGLPRITSADAHRSVAAAERGEAMSSARALRRGITLTLACTAVLVTAVGTTWYGPVVASPAVRVRTPEAVLCGRQLQFGPGQTATLVRKTDHVQLQTNELRSVQPVETCPP